MATQKLKRIIALGSGIVLALLILAIFKAYHSNTDSASLGASGDHTIVKSEHQLRPDNSSSGNTRPKRPALDDNQINNRVNSLLDLREGEVGIVAIPPGEAIKAISIDTNDPHQVASNFKFIEISDDAIEPIMTKTLSRGGNLKSTSGASDITKIQDEDSSVTVMMSKKDSDHSDFVIVFKGPDLSMTKTVSIKRGNSLLIAPDDSGKKSFLVVIGNQ